MNFQLINARVFGKPKNELFDIEIVNGQIASLYPVGINWSTERKIDLQGCWLAPSFIDFHVHTTNTGVKLKGLDLSHCKSYEELSSTLMRLSQNETIIIGHGWDDSKWSKKADIHLFAENAPPVYLSRIDAHSALASPSLLKLVPEITQSVGFSATHPLTADAHGLLRDFAYSALTPNQRHLFINAGIDEYLSFGITEVHEMAGPRISSYEDAQMVQKTSTERKIDLKLWWGEMNGHQNAKNLGAYGCGGDLFIDGSFGSKTAYLSKPYEDGGNGNLYLDENQATEHILKGYEFHLPTSFHAIGDGAIDVALSAFENARMSLGEANYRELSHRIEHAEFLVGNSLNRISKLNLTLSMQPQFSSSWSGENGMYSQRIGNRWNDLNPFRPILVSGIRLAFGSDSPVTDVNPWLSIAAATNMANPDFSISTKSAFRAHTNSDFEIGSPANIAVWDVGNWQEIQVDSVKNRWSTDARSFPRDFPDPSNPPNCQMTISKGEIVFSKLGHYDE